MHNFRNNFFIPAPFIVVLDENRKSLGSMPAGKAKELANTRDVDLVCVDPRANPPVYALGEGPSDGAISATVRLLNGDRTQVGVFPIEEARKMASDRGEDLILINGKCDPNVCMIGDRKKYEYDKKKAAKENEKKQRAIAKASELKELKFPSDTSDSSKGDRDRLFERAVEFSEEGHPVKISVRFRGRLMAHAADVMDRLHDEAVEKIPNAQVGRPVAAGNVYSMMCTPAKKK